jgi:flagellar motor switch protein FliN/FliY
MQMHLRFDDLTRAFTDELAAGWSSRLGHTLVLAPAGATAGPGWIVTVAVSGAANGLLAVWFGRESARACARVALGGDAEPDDPSVTNLLENLVAHAAANLETSAVGAGLTIGATDVRAGACPADAQGFAASVTDQVSCQFAVEVRLSAASGTAATSDRRLEAVLDVDLPLIVRFGRAVMPLRAVADLGPGSVVDMGRSPDDPVELLVGERVIARGEVVIVAGNYGVRITELMGGREGAPELEARAS